MYLKEELYELMRTDETIFDFIQHSLLDGIWYWDLENPENEWFNSKFWTVLGYNPDEMPHKSSAWQDIINRDDLRVAIENFNRHCNDPNHPYDQVVRYKHINGSTVWIRCRGLAIRDVNGKPIRMLGAHYDITDQKQIELELAESAERFKSLHNASFGGIAIHDKGVILECNQGLSAMTGYSLDELIGMDGLLLIAPEHRAMVMSNIISFNEKPYEAKGLRKNGEQFPMRLEARNIPYKGRTVRTVEFRDITESKKAEEALRESEERFYLAMKASNDGLFDWNLETNEIYYSPGWKKMLGYEDNELPNDFSVWEKTTDPDDVKRSWELQQKVIKREVDRFVMEFKMRRKDGNWVDILSRAEAIFDESGKAIRMVGTHTDITERKQTELLLRAKNREIAVQNDELNLKNQELIEAKSKAEESDRLKSAFLANMSHEIRTPMNGILGFADLLKEPNLSSDMQHEYIKIIEKSGARMLNIINHIVDISKIEAGLMELDCREYNINDQLEYIYTFFKPEADSKRIKLFFVNSLPDNEAIITTDHEKLYAIFTNLVKNAIKYTNEGSVEFGYRINKDTKPAEFEFYVRDTGIGIRNDRQEAIFERFIQADFTDKMAYDGAGLGLAVTKAFVEMLFGKIWVVSEVGKGSTFYFTMPYKTNLSTLSAPSQPELLVKCEDLRNIKILIAEDDEVSGLLIEKYVKIFGKEILKARTGVEALDICRVNPDIDLIFMDIRMPEMDGYEAIMEIRKFNKDVIIIAQTAFGLSGDRDKALASGCNDYIAKPIIKTELHALIKKYFGEE